MSGFINGVDVAVARYDVADLPVSCWEDDGKRIMRKMGLKTGGYKGIGEEGMMGRGTVRFGNVGGGRGYGWYRDGSGVWVVRT